ncbi:hypothetical protein Q4F19_18105 [Sphingomonas sp. BIUV-7]|uniref:Uncharacterized protein n=1 Tax=Sphingomonas natans TaxID=3063330 RepID=A0ABT8YD97_9SPHN|nr:hypothetical protein [Sphingomonas sp. BIUV-7]
MIGDAGDVAGRQQHVPHAWSLAIGQPAGAFGDHASGDASRQPAENAEPREASSGNGLRLPYGIIGHADPPG